MPTFTVQLPGVIPVWCPVLIAQLTKCFDGISEQINDLGDKFNDFGRKFDSMQVAVKSEFKDIRNIATDTDTDTDISLF